MTLHPHLALVPLKRKPVAKGKRAPRASSIVDAFCPLPELSFAADSVAPDVCLLALVGGRAPRVARHGDVRDDNRLATTRVGPASVETAVPWPRSGWPALPPHYGWSDSPSQ